MMADSGRSDGHDGIASPLARKRPSGLGRGLSALLGDSAPQTSGGDTPITAATALVQDGGPGLQAIRITSISPLPGQPRRHFDPDSLGELADSIRVRGVVQPIIVRPHPGGEGYQLVAGERRWRAAQQAGLHDIPAIVRALDDGATYEIALIENIQRQDLNAIDEATAYRRLIADFGHAQEVLAKLVGKSRSHVANLMRLLDLPAAVQLLVTEGKLSMGHARALVGSPDAEALAVRCVKDGLSVRAVESLVRKAKPEGAARAPRDGASVAKVVDSDILAVEQHLADLLGLKVDIAYKGEGAGSVTLQFRTLDQLDMLCQRLSGESI